MYNSDTITVKKPTTGAKVRVVSALYLDGYRINVFFSDGTNKVVDFFGFLNNTKGYLSKYRDFSNFSKFSIDGGNVVWGEDWDLIFPVDQLYRGYIE